MRRTRAACRAGRAGGGEAGDSSADYEDIDVDVEVFVGVGVAALRGPARDPPTARMKGS